MTVLDLSVSWNFLGNLPAAAFEGTNAFRLSLGFNRIRRVEPTAFSSLEGTLTYLNLENNELEAVPWESLQNLSSLQHFYMGSNLIRDDNINNLDGNHQSSSSSYHELSNFKKCHQTRCNSGVQFQVSNIQWNRPLPLHSLLKRKMGPISA